MNEVNVNVRTVGVSESCDEESSHLGRFPIRSLDGLIEAFRESCQMFGIWGEEDPGSWEVSGQWMIEGGQTFFEIVVVNP